MTGEARSFLPLVAPLLIITACAAQSSRKDSSADLAGDVQVVPELAAEPVAEVAALPPAELVLPPYPWWPNDGLAVDESLLAGKAGEWCAATGGEGGAPAFFFKGMPLESVAGLCDPEGPGPAVLLGHMYLSGWYGGLWFRDNADLGMGHPGGEGEEGPQEGPVTADEFLGIADNAAALAALAASGAPADVFAHNLDGLLGPPGGSLFDSLMDSLLTLYGYNHGYVKAILANPPEGVDAAGKTNPCPKYLDCPVAGSPLEAHEAYRDALKRLDEPPNETWEKLAAEVTKSEGWVAIGEGLWSDGSITPAAWGVLVDINRAYLAVTATAALASLMGHGDKDEDAGRCALLLEAATDTWNRAYFLALGADAEEGTLPEVVCP